MIYYAIGIRLFLAGVGLKRGNKYVTSRSICATLPQETLHSSADPYEWQSSCPRYKRACTSRAKHEAKRLILNTTKCSIKIYDIILIFT